MPVDDAPSDLLRTLAQAHGVATEYWSFFGEQVHVPASTLRSVLTAMGVPAADDDEAAAALSETEVAPWRRLVPASAVVRSGSGTIHVHVADGHDVTVTAVLEDGSTRALDIPVQQPVARTVDGVTRWRVAVPVPDDMPLGWHVLRARQTGPTGPSDGEGAQEIGRARIGRGRIGRGRVGRGRVGRGWVGRSWVGHGAGSSRGGHDPVTRSNSPG